MLNLVTGKIGSGKSQVISILEEKGFTCLKLDDYVKELHSEPDAFKTIVSIFGSQCLDPLGNISRNFLRNAFMSNDDLVQKAYKIYEDYITLRCYKKVAPMITCTEPIFIEFAWAKKFVNYCITNRILFSNVLIVYADDTIRNKRLLNRGMSQELIDHTNKIQDWEIDTKYLTDNCNKILNSGSISDLFDNVQRVLESCKFSPEERNIVFQSFYIKSPAFVKPNVHCYLYHSMFGCAKCPFPCSNSDKHFEEAMKRQL